MNDWFQNIFQFIRDGFTTDGFAYHWLGMPERAAAGAKQIDNLIVYVHWLMLVLFIGWTFYFCYALWRFNAKRATKADYAGSTSKLPKYSEIAVVIVEVLLLACCAIPIWGKNVKGFPEAKDAVVVQVQAQQFGWNFRYAGPDGKFGQQDMKLISDSNLFGVDPKDPAGKDDVQYYNGNLHVVLNKPVLLYISSKDVIHSFKVVSMRVTQDAIPGLRIPITFTPTKLGRYQVECAQLCGGGHSAMAGGFVLVETQEEFDKWMKTKTASASPTSFE
jgi:cytochrome c oxidase subunit 2